jgi:hypothetical protein
MNVMKRISLIIAAAACSGVIGCANETGAEDVASTDEALTTAVRLTCESWDHRYNSCDVNTFGGRIVDVRVVRQLSSASCNEGSSWGYGEDYVWVDRGCRAEFEVRVRNGGGGHRPEITLYEHDNFGGRSLRLRGAASDLANLDFNDTTSSVIVRNGTWTLCRHANFSGVCMTFEPGEYRSVLMNDAFSSARPN